MNDVALKPQVQEIVVDEVFPHAPELLWKALSDGNLIGRWLMEPSGFEAVVGKQFTFKIAPAGEWDGLIRCQVLEAIPNERLVYAWNSGHDGNVGYGARLETVVTWTLSKVSGGTRLRLVHAGFVIPRNGLAYTNMGQGWLKVLRRLDAVVAGREPEPGKP